MSSVASASDPSLWSLLMMKGAEKVAFKWRGDLERPSCVCQTGWWWMEMPPRLDAVSKPCASSWLCTKSNLGKTQVRQPRDGRISKQRGGEREIKRGRGAQHGCPEQPAAVTEREDMQTFICRLFLEALADWLATCADSSAQSHGGTKAGAMPDRRTQSELGSSCHRLPY